MTTQTLSSKRLEFTDVAEMIESYFDRGWTDGLPVVPPTVDRIEEFIATSGRSPAEILGTEPVRGRVVTLEKVAINAVMAGCRPEYFPVVVGAVEAMLEPEYNLHAVTASTMGAAQLLVVNGPIATEIALNSGVGVFGPGHRANATIGRAVRLTIINVTGAVSGELDQATLGHAGKYTWCIAEAEEASPWEPLHTGRGFSAKDSTVTVFSGLAPIQVTANSGNTPEEALTSCIDGLFLAGSGNAEIVVVLALETVGHIRAAGWSKQQVAQFLWENSRRTADEWAKRGVYVEGSEPDESDGLVGVAQSPESISIVVAGGRAGGFSSIIPLWGNGSNSRSVTKKIRS